jgi:parallel beta-helix repeat protein
VAGSTTGNGSAGNPWPSLEWIVSNNKIESMKPVNYPYLEGDPLEVRNEDAPVQPGDTIILRSGDHGDVWIVGYFNTDWITLRAAEGHTPVLQHLIIRGGRKWHIDGVTISKEPHGAPNTETLMYFNSHGWHGPVSDCVIENSHVYSAEDSSAWTVDDWQAKAAGGGIYADGKRITIRNCTVRNIKMGILAGGDDCVIENNILQGIAHDGFRSAADRIVWQYNRLSDFVKIDENHDDIIQLYRGGGVAHDAVIIRGNYFDGRKITDRPLTTSPQGVGCFDGPYTNCVVENNIVLTAHYHGISLYGAEGCRIVNNTVLDPSRQYPAWITTSSPDGGDDVIVRNNMSYSVVGSNATAGIVSDHNIQLTDAQSDAIFVDWRNGDVHLKAGSPAIDAGSADQAPTEDIDRAPRPSGQGVDIGAYEVQVTSGQISSWSLVATHGATEMITEVADDFIEPRAAGVRKIRIAFDDPLDAGTVAPGIVTITGQTGGSQAALIQSVTLEGDRTVVVTLSAPLPNADWYTLAVSTDLHLAGGSPVTGDLDIRLGALVGDVNASGIVSAADVVALRALVDQPLAADNAPKDLDHSGTIVGSDMLLIRKHTGAALP